MLYRKGADIMSKKSKKRKPAGSKRPQPTQTNTWSLKKKLLIGLGAAGIIILIAAITTLAGRPPMTITATIETNKGDLVLELFAKDVPVTVNNFVSLARDGFYDGLTFHRVIADFMVQGGDPTGTGAGGPGYTFADEFTEYTHVTGALSMANAGPNTNGSQFFITYTPQHHPDGHHSVFGQLIEGEDVLNQIRQGDIMKRITIEEK